MQLGRMIFNYLTYSSVSFFSGLQRFISYGSGWHLAHPNTSYTTLKPHQSALLFLPYRALPHAPFPNLLSFELNSISILFDPHTSLAFPFDGICLWLHTIPCDASLPSHYCPQRSTYPSASAQPLHNRATPPPTSENSPRTGKPRKPFSFLLNGARPDLRHLSNVAAPSFAISSALSSPSATERSEGVLSCFTFLERCALTCLDFQ